MRIGLVEMATDCLWYPTAETVNESADWGTDKLNVPEADVVVPMFGIPFTTTEPITGVPCSSVTVPEIILFCALT